MTVQSAALDQLAGASSSATSSQKTSNKAELGRDQFLKLLITQLKNQDPLNPMESVEFTSQLAQFSSLEQLFSVGDSLQAIKTSLQLQEGDQMVQYIGKKVVSKGDTLTVQGGEPGSATFRLDDDAEVSVSVYSPAGALIRRLSMGWQKKGDCQVPWDGRDQSGKAVSDGDYSFQVEAVNAEGSSVSSQTYVTGEVTGVRHENGKSFLLLGTRQILPESILEISKL
jgi:flagellar basal-body rod modification protein FlgD